MSPTSRGTGGGDTRDTANELHRVAWTYLGQEEENTRTFAGEVSYAPDEDAESHPSSSPELPSLDPAETLRAAAQNRDAPVELIRVARAVRDGRTSRQEIVDGQASSVPEVAAFLEHMNRELARFIDSGALRDPLPTRQDGPPPDTAHERLTPPTRDDDGDEIEIRWVRRWGFATFRSVSPSSPEPSTAASTGTIRR